MNVDDMEEATVEDITDYGKFCFASCWTKDHDESIALWSLYTPNMEGVRIKLPENAFVTYRDDRWNPRGGYDEHKKKKWTCKEIQEIEENYEYDISFDFIDVGYTSDIEKLNSRIMKFTESEDENENESFSFDQSEVGKWKKPQWTFQKESRFLIKIKPVNEDNRSPRALKGLRSEYNLFKNALNSADYDLEYIDISINPEALKKMEIVCGPRMTETEKIIVQALVKSYNSDAKIKDSTLPIRNKN